MRYIKTNFIRKVFIVCFFVFFINLNCFGYFMLNGSDEGYTGQGENRDTTIKNYVTVGASYFLKCCSDLQKFLDLYELQDKNGIDYNEWQTVINSAWGNMNNAAQIYDLLIKKAESTPYDEEFISRLMSFNYTTFMKENGLNSVIFRKCEEYLKNGDITGMYKHTYAVFTDILDMLGSVKDGLSAARLPQLSILWKINETCAELSLFGQYSSRVFYVIN